MLAAAAGLLWRRRAPPRRRCGRTSRSRAPGRSSGRRRACTSTDQNDRDSKDCGQQVVVNDPLPVGVGMSITATPSSFPSGHWKFSGWQGCESVSGTNNTTCNVSAGAFAAKTWDVRAVFDDFVAPEHRVRADRDVLGDPGARRRVLLLLQRGRHDPVPRRRRALRGLLERRRLRALRGRPHLRRARVRRFRQRQLDLFAQRQDRRHGVELPARPGWPGQQPLRPLRLHDGRRQLVRVLARRRGLQRLPGRPGIDYANLARRCSTRSPFERATAASSTTSRPRGPGPSTPPRPRPRSTRCTGPGEASHRHRCGRRASASQQRGGLDVPVLARRRGVHGPARRRPRSARLARGRPHVPGARDRQGRQHRPDARAALLDRRPAGRRSRRLQRRPGLQRQRPGDQPGRGGDPRQRRRRELRRRHRRQPRPRRRRSPAPGRLRRHQRGDPPRRRRHPGQRHRRGLQRRRRPRAGRRSAAGRPRSRPPRPSTSRSRSPSSWSPTARARSSRRCR